MRRPIWSLVLFAAGCSRGAAPGLVQQGSSAEPDGPDPVVAAVCGDRPGCAVETELLLSRGPDGREQLAVVARLAPHEQSRADHTIADGELNLGGPNPCTPFETSLVSRRERDAVRSQSLVTDCLVDPKPVPPVVEKDGDGLRYRITSRLRNDDPEHRLHPVHVVSEVTDFALDPPRLLRTTQRAYREGDPDSVYESTWDWQTFRGQECWYGPNCAPILPYVSVPGAGKSFGGTAAFAAGGWKTTSLGGCAMLLQGSTASVRLVMMEAILYVEISDDRFVTDGGVVDAVEIEVIPEGLMPDGHILHQRLSMDGRLSDDRGRKRQLDVVEVNPTTRRFALSAAWPWEAQSWSLAYVDTDDGRTVHERIALPTASSHAPSVLWFDWRATCIVANGTLEPVHSPAPRSADE